jgi:hypothetical protein
MCVLFNCTSLWFKNDDSNCNLVCTLLEWFESGSDILLFFSLRSLLCERWYLSQRAPLINCLRFLSSSTFLLILIRLQYCWSSLVQLYGIWSRILGDFTLTEKTEIQDFMTFRLSISQDAISVVNIMV